MNLSFTLGRIAGIKILMHWTFLILLAWIVFSEIGKGSDTYTILMMVLLVLSIFACVVLHELGHSLTARKYGIDTKKITLLPIGGVASLERMPDDPKQELWIALAGPAVNVVIAIILFFFLPLDKFSNPEDIPTTISGDNFLIALFSINVFLVLFNAIPAFPMDGGRILRALLALKMDKVKATQIAATLGKFFAAGFVVVGLFYNPFLIFIGIFVYFGAYAENVMVQHQSLLKGYKVRDAMMTNIITLHPDDTVESATEKLLSGSEQDFLVVDNGKIVGILTRDILINALHQKAHQTPISKIMSTTYVAYNAEESLNSIYATSQRTKTFFSPVMENDQLVGVINKDNLNEFLMVRSALRIDNE